MLPAVFDFLNGPVRDLVTQIYDAVGYLGVALWVAIESVIIPIPSELVLPFAGFLVGEGVAVEPLTGAAWNYWLVVIAGTIGATIGALIAYGIGAWGGRPIIERWGRYLGITTSDLDRADGFFARHGQAASFFGRMIPIIRSLVSFAAGVARMPLGRFTLFTFLGSLPWTAAARLRRRRARRELGGGRRAGSSGSSTRSSRSSSSSSLAWIWFRIIKPRRAARAGA